MVIGFFLCRDGGAPVGGCGLCGSPPVTKDAVLDLVPLAGRRPWLVFLSNRRWGVMSRSLSRGGRCGVLFRLLPLLCKGDGCGAGERERLAALVPLPGMARTAGMVDPIAEGLVARCRPPVIAADTADTSIEITPPPIVFLAPWPDGDSRDFFRFPTAAAAAALAET